MKLVHDQVEVFTSQNVVLATQDLSATSSVHIASSFNVAVWCIYSADQKVLGKPSF